MSNSKLQISLAIADNGSTDNTLQLANMLASKHKNIRTVSVSEKGVGRALKESWSTSTADYIGYMDLDLSTDLIHLQEVVDVLIRNHYQVLSGSRLLKDSVVSGRSVLRNITSRSFNLIIKIVFKTRITDGMCGFKFLNRALFRELLEAGATSDGWFFSTQILLTSESLNIDIYEIPVLWNDDSDSKVKIIRLSLEYLREISKLRNEFLKGERNNFVRF